MTKTNEDGFSMVEMAVVFSIMTIMVMMAIPIYSSAMDVAEETTAIEDIKSIANAIDTFHLNNGMLPESLVQVGMNDRKDPWGNFYVYKKIEAPKVDGVRPKAPKGGGSTTPTYTTNPDGSVSIDLNGDGSFDMRLNKLTPAMITKLATYAKRLDSTNTPLNSDYDLFSIGEDGDTEELLDAKACEDDIIRARNGEFVDRGDRY